jgi:hypothetical protein
VPLALDDTIHDYRLAAEVGCYPGCGVDEADIQWWHAWRCGTLPVRLAEEPDERAKRYALGCVKRIWGDLPDRPTHAQLRRATFASGQWLQAGKLPDRLIAQAVVLAAQRAVVDPQTLATDLLAGRARPAQLPEERRP